MTYSKYIVLFLSIFFFSSCSNQNDSQSVNSQISTPKSTDSPVNSQISTPKSTDSSVNSANILIPISINASSGGGTSNIIDGDLTTTWNSGGPAPQWIQLDLGKLSDVSKIRLNISQDPAGHTVHEIYGGVTPDKLTLLGKLDGNTKDNQWLELSLSAKDIRYLKVDTKTSPSWVSWREIQVIK